VRKFARTSLLAAFLVTALAGCASYNFENFINDARWGEYQRRAKIAVDNANSHEDKLLEVAARFQYDPSVVHRVIRTGHVSKEAALRIAGKICLNWSQSKRDSMFINGHQTIYGFQPHDVSALIVHMYELTEDEGRKLIWVSCRSR
jgi:hypothetical protein